MKEPIESFLNYLAVEKGYSEHTISAYRNDLTGLAEFAEKEASKQRSCFLGRFHPAEHVKLHA